MWSLKKRLSLTISSKIFRPKHGGISLITLLILSIITILAAPVAMTSVAPEKSAPVRYKTTFGSCPSRTAGNLTLKLVKVFEETRGLHDVKRMIISDNLKDKFFISDYKISYDPIKNYLQFEFNCPSPLMKVQVYRDGSNEYNEAILVESGELFDPTYEELLRREKKLNYELPFLALPVGEIQAEIQSGITKLVGSLDLKFRKKIAEVIVNDEKELIIIMSLSGHPSSVFMGSSQWTEKLLKLQKIVKYMESKKKIPAVINLTNAKKVVVKFNDKS